MLLQTAGIINAESTFACRSTFEYDTCFKTAMPSIDNDNNNNNINPVNSADPRPFTDIRGTRNKCELLNQTMEYRHSPPLEG